MEVIFVSAKGEWGIKLYEMENMVAMYINEYAGNRSWAKSIIQALVANKTPIYMLHKRLNNNIKKIADANRGIKIFYEIEDNKTGIYIGGNAQAASTEIKNLGSDKTSIYFINSYDCSKVKEEILNISESNNFGIKEQDIEEGKYENS